jgi:hypothetical protein
MASPRRDTVLDAMRTLAILLMAMSHVTRLVPAELRPGWGPWSLLVEPYTQALFLGLVGASLVHSRQSSVRRGQTGWAWSRSRLGRMGQLYLLSVVVFWLERGPQWPHGLTSTGILALIAGAIAIFTATVAAPRALLVTAGVTAGLGALAAALDLMGAQVLALNAGNGPLLPTALYAGLGATAVLAWSRWGRPAAAALLVVGAACVVGSLWLAPFSDILTEPLGRTLHTLELRGRGNGFTITRDLLTGAELRPRRPSYFNPRPTVVPLVFGMVVLTYVALAPLRPLWQRVARHALSIGRYSLGTYLFHLLLVAIPVLVRGTSRPLDSTAAAWGYYAFVVAACYGFAHLRMWQDARTRAG